MQWFSENANLIIGLVFVLTILFKGRILALIFKIKSIGVTELKKIVDTNITLLDVRTPTEYNQGHIPNAVNLPLQEFTQERVKSLNLNPNEPIYLICASGNRSLWASITMKKWGFSSPINISGGMLFYNRD